MGGQSSTAKGAMIGQSIDPIGGGLLGGYLGNQKGGKKQGPFANAVQGRYDPHIAQNMSTTNAPTTNTFKGKAQPGTAQLPGGPGLGAALSNQQSAPAMMTQGGYGINNKGATQGRYDPHTAQNAPIIG